MFNAKPKYKGMGFIDGFTHVFYLIERENKESSLSKIGEGGQHQVNKYRNPNND